MPYVPANKPEIVPKPIEMVPADVIGLPVITAPGFEAVSATDVTKPLCDMPTVLTDVMRPFESTAITGMTADVP